MTATNWPTCSHSHTRIEVDENPMFRKAICFCPGCGMVLAMTGFPVLNKTDRAIAKLKKGMAA
jgi:hypothetical protein